MAGNFFDKADHNSIYLENSGILHARLRDDCGQWCDASINLNDYIGNDNGRFYWGGCSYSDNGELFDVYIEGAGPVCVLRGKLRDGCGNLIDSDLNLAERLGSQNGYFIFV
ncbi:Cyanovirin-N [Xylariales sp. PMI_506]|nr:Cyanovirin-N [Xylariales sp. PMI_506]